LILYKVASVAWGIPWLCASKSQFHLRCSRLL
jgi:hypothetical protein